MEEEEKNLQVEKEVERLDLHFIRRESPKIVKTMKISLEWFEEIIAQGRYTNEDLVVYLTYLDSLSLQLSLVRRSYVSNLK